MFACKLVQKHRIYPNKAVREFINKQEGCNRFVWNETLAHMKRLGYWLSYREMSEFLTRELKTKFPFLYEASAQSLQQSLKDLDRAIKNNWRKTQPANEPKFKKRVWRKSCRFTKNIRVDRTKKLLYLPKMHDNPIKIILERNLPDFTMCTIIKESDDRYYACFIVEKECQEHVKWHDMQHLGVDLGLTDFLVTSKRERIKSPQFFRKSEDNISRKQRGLSKKTKGSRAFKKFQKKVARAYSKSKWQRQDWLHKLSHQIANDNAVEGVGAETLRITNMLQNSKLSKSINDASWYTFLQYLNYKLQLRGKILTLIDSGFASTQTCSNTMCHKKTGPKGVTSLGVRTWTCTACGATHDRDLNAAINIGKRADWLYGSYAA